MTPVLLVYASMTGNTEEIAEWVAKGVRDAGVSIEVKEVMDTDPADLEQYGLILLGAYTWGDGELPDEFLDLYEEMDGLDLSGKAAAVFGSCDSSYPMVGAAVDILEKKLEERGARLVLPGLKVEFAPDEEEGKHCQSWGRSAVEKAADQLAEQA
ncbi:flavodoxin [Desmospora profundinema]|uniref:Flavodoxin n=1 Tax=Desmospora profundinema TaxID=1571184 RepID=A0ABU1IPP8_9BACL|nr:flavodoxin [Desmospora profundinema]MDR6225730.1 flavodoxin I [Desmospora profundinema]